MRFQKRDLRHLVDAGGCATSRTCSARTVHRSYVERPGCRMRRASLLVPMLAQPLGRSPAAKLPLPSPTLNEDPMAAATPRRHALIGMTEDVLPPPFVISPNFVCRINFETRLHPSGKCVSCKADSRLGSLEIRQHCAVGSIATSLPWLCWETLGCAGTGYLL